MAAPSMFIILMSGMDNIIVMEAVNMSILTTLDTLLWEFLIVLNILISDIGMLANVRIIIVEAAFPA
jgi:hypothetical protein